MGQPQYAIDMYRKAIQVDGQDAWSMNNLALIFIEQELFYDALPPLARAIEIRSDVPLFHNNLGMALEHTGRYRAAEEAYAAAVAIDDSYGKAVDNLARVEEVVEEFGYEPVDFAALAQSFVDEIVRWEAASSEPDEQPNDQASEQATDAGASAMITPAASKLPADSIMAENTIVSVPDSTVKEQQR
jgi:tetratricopeptide (TPR) repeat protein